jgi:hypothetical protein
MSESCIVMPLTWLQRLKMKGNMIEKFCGLFSPASAVVAPAIRAILP